MDFHYTVPDSQEDVDKYSELDLLQMMMILFPISDSIVLGLVEFRKQCS
jgi:hypothetical protein